MPETPTKANKWCGKNILMVEYRFEPRFGECPCLFHDFAATMEEGMVKLNQACERSGRSGRNSHHPKA